MRLFRRPTRDGSDPPQPSVDLYGEPDSELVESISASPLGQGERERIETELETLATAGIDVDDIRALAAAFDAAVDRHDDAMLRPLSMGVGEHLTRHANMRWAVITDSFGRDLGVEGRRRDLHVIPDSLLAARWMRGEKGWLEGVVRHLKDMSGR